MGIIDFINDLNASGKLEYNDYSQLHDLARDLKAENAELKARLEKAVELPDIMDFAECVVIDYDISKKRYVLEEYFFGGFTVGRRKYN